ncbi:FAD/NAD(P)-binding protein [Mesorhizobium sp.]|uniref:FAD/NAD(P)-binding protein n=1 Tax=Mesorhizobium sp. TaxID=1871066 RepID=UPI0011F4FEDC|nr:FAD/NAD(P)-binding protein [Mesorhizobium sp.]TIT04030.1 MAG: hypothetical protein E5W87_02710 [Mesorhizobium sp.]
MTVAYRGKWNSAAPTASTRSIAIIGGGASGVLMAAHLLRSRDPGLDIIIIEKRRSLGRGLAYSTDFPDHVLNVRASNMSAFADDPDHFVHWLQNRNIRIDDPTTCFAPRRLYGRISWTTAARNSEKEQLIWKIADNRRGKRRNP